MHTQLSPPRSATGGLRSASAGLALIISGFGAQAAAPTTAPQVLLAITNSESMDGNTAGAIMIGSGGLGSANSTLTGSSSPTNFAIPPGFTPPLNAGSGGNAPWTVSCNNGDLCDNGASRMNMTKAAITQVLASYGSSLNFGIYTYSTGAVSLYNTWVYYMSPAGGFTFTNTASATTVPNPCYNYTNASTNVKSTCTQVAAQYANGVMAANAYMNIAATSDDPLINDVLYYTGSAISSELLTFGTVAPTNPYTTYTLQTYNTNLSAYKATYSKTAPNINGWATYPTNAGYIPSTPQVLYSERGFGYGASQSATTGALKVAMSTDPATSTAFTTALAPESNNVSSSEIKSLAGQSSIYGLLNGAKSYLGGLTKATCQTQYVVLLTDGLPTMDKIGSIWPPLGTTTANAYNLAATYNGAGAFVSSNSQAVTDTLASITALYGAGIKVYVIGLGAGVDSTTNPSAAQLLKAMAIAGGSGDYFKATDSNSLNTAFLTIINQIYSEASIAAPVAPISVAGGSAYEYELTTIASPGAGHVKALPVDSAGVITSNTASWDAGGLMTPTLRTNALMAAKADNTIVALANVDVGAFNLTATSCVPNVATIIAYTVDPSFTYNGCSYLAGRRAGWSLGPFSTQNTGRYVGPPSSGLLTQKYASYVTYARAQATRAPLLMFTSEDGFLYGVDAGTGFLQWAWTSRSLLAKMQNYTTFESSGPTDGGFIVADAIDSSGSSPSWGSYVVGSLQSGAEHYVLKLGNSGTPTRVVYDNVIAGGSSAADKAGVSGAKPLRQPPVIAYIGNNAYYVYVTTVGSITTLYELNIATGVPSSVALPFQLSSALHYNASTGQLWMGASNGDIWVTTLTSGTAATDVALLLNIGTTVTPGTGNALGNVLYVGYTEVGGIPYVYALNPSQLTVFGVTSKGWTPLWASTPTQGYAFGGSTWSTSGTVTTLTANSVVSDIPVVVGTALLVPTFVPGSGCSAGTGYYDIFSLALGTFPSDLALTQNGSSINADIRVGLGPAFTPSATMIAGGVALNPASSAQTTPQAPLSNKGALAAKAISWRQH